MSNEYALQGLACADCAAQIEVEVSRLQGVKSASLNFATTTLRIETHSNADDIEKRVKEIVRRVEPGVSVAPKTSRAADAHHHEHTSKKRDMILPLAGVGLFAASLLASLPLWAEISLFVASYLLIGGPVVWMAARNLIRGRLFDENFLMTIATIGAFSIGEYPEAVSVMLFYRIGEYFQEAALRKSRRSIAALMDIRPDFARLVDEAGTREVAPETLAPGAMILVKPGERIPLDGVVTEGESLLDTSALTGESAPRQARPGDTVISGCINQSGVLKIRVEKTLHESTVSKILDLVENASSKKAQTENFITAFSRYYTPAVVLLAALVALIPPLLTGGGFADWLYRGLVFLVISCPCALVISIPLSFFGGIGGASKNGVLVKGGNYLEALSRIDTVAFDKTGTLTKGRFRVTRTIPAAGWTEDALLKAAATAEWFSNHPIAASVKEAYGLRRLESDLAGMALEDYEEIAGLGVRIRAGTQTIVAGNKKLMEQIGVVFTPHPDAGTKLYVSVDGAYAGCIIIADEVKPDSRAAIDALRALGVRKTVMLTGDEEGAAREVAQAVGVDAVYARLLPHQKVERMEALALTKSKKGTLVFVGDGINDAPVLALADVGVAMGGLGSDAAIEAADVVLMTDEPTRLVTAVNIARKTQRIVWQNVALALGIKALVLILGAFGFAGMWAAVFADVGVALMATLNAIRALTYKAK